MTYTIWNIVNDGVILCEHCQEPIREIEEDLVLEDRSLFHSDCFAYHIDRNLEMLMREDVEK